MEPQPPFIRYVYWGLALDAALAIGIALVFINNTNSLGGIFMSMCLIGIITLTVHTIIIPTLMLSLGSKGFQKLLWATPLSVAYVFLAGVIVAGGIGIPIIIWELFGSTRPPDKAAFMVAPIVAAVVSLCIADKINVPENYRQSFKPLLKAGGLCGITAWLILWSQYALPLQLVFVVSTVASGVSLSYLYNTKHYARFSLENKSVT